MRLQQRRPSMLVLGIWLIAQGLFFLMPLFSGAGSLLALIGVVAGVLILIDR
jgi:hypothetical protein